jgi:alpha/beta hydrolase fold
LAIGAAAVLIFVVTGCGVGKPTSPEKVSETATSYLKALAAGHAARACADLTPRRGGASCERAVREHGSLLDARALIAAADASMGKSRSMATRTLARPHGARLVLARVGGRWRIESGYAVPSGVRARRADPVLVGGGRLVDIGGRRLYLKCVGSGAPTVVLEAGFGGSSEDWRDVQRQLGRATRTCAYDRAGLGSSLPMPGVHDAGDEVRDLRRLLDAAHLERPYVLVGHSYGGLLVRLFAHSHPADVAGVVLLDAMGRDQTRRQLANWPEHDHPGGAPRRGQVGAGRRRSRLWRGGRPPHREPEFGAAGGDHGRSP